MSKRMLMVVSDQHLIPHGGIGQFVVSMSRKAVASGWYVDIAADKELRYDSWAANAINGFVQTPFTPLSYGTHNKNFMFSDSYCFERVINFRDSVIQALSKSVYDLIVLNTPEALIAVRAMNIEKFVPIVFYTHNENLVFPEDVKKRTFNEQYDLIMSDLVSSGSGVTLGTQTETNANALKTNLPDVDVRYLPMPVPEPLLLSGNDIHIKGRSGVLFIGRFEDRKGPKDFIEMIKATGLPAKVMTNDTGARKFREALNKNQLSDENLKVSITGKEKVDFMKSARVHFNPSIRESFGYALFECAHLMPCVVYDDVSWVDNFASLPLIKTNKSKLNDEINLLYNANFRSVVDAQIAELLEWDKQTMLKWEEFVDSFKLGYDASERGEIQKLTSTFMNDYFKQHLKRDHMSIEEIKSVLRNSHSFQKIQVVGGTVLSKDGTMPVTETQASLEDLF
jgi:glycosyltransferase involved in cell wall biosynthesis